MNTKNRLIEKLLKVAKRHKILTYPVLALVACISFFANLFNWKNGYGKRVVAIVMVMVLFVSQSYFLTSSANSLVDTEEEEQIQQELQAEQDPDEETEQNDALVEASTEISEETVAEDQPGSDEVGQQEPSAEDQENGAQDENVADDPETENVSKKNVAQMSARIAAEAITINFNYSDGKGAGTLYSTTGAGEGVTYSEGMLDVSTLVASSSFKSVIATLASQKGWRYDTVNWYYDVAMSQPVTLSAIPEGDIVNLYCKQEIAQYNVTVTHSRSTNSNAAFSTNATFTPALTDGLIRVSIPDGTEQAADLTLSGISRVGYTLADATVSGGGEVTSITADSVTVHLTGSVQAKAIDLKWKPDTYKLQYEAEDGTVLHEQTVQFDEADYFWVGDSGVKPDAGYKFADKWSVVGKDLEVTANDAVAHINGTTNPLYEAADCVVVLKPVFQYDGVKLSSTEVQNLTYKSATGSQVIQAQYQSIENTSTGNFSYALSDDGGLSQNALDEYGIKFENLGVNGFQLMPNETVNGKSSPKKAGKFTIKVKVTDANAKTENEKTSEFTIEVTVKQCQVTIVQPDSLKTTKEYDGTTNPAFTGTDALTLQTSDEAITVTCDPAKAYYNSKNVAEADKIIFPKNSYTIVAAGGEDISNYHLVMDDAEGCYISGKITPKSIKVIPRIHFENGLTYVRAGEDDPKFTFEIEDENDLVAGDVADWLDQITYTTTRPDDLLAERKGNEACRIDDIDTSGIPGGSNYDPQCTSTAVKNASYQVIMEDTVENDNYTVAGTVLDGRDWYYDQNHNGLTITPNGVYNTVYISRDGGNSYDVLDRFTEEDSSNNGIMIYLKSDRNKDGGTGAQTRPTALKIRYDSSAPVYGGYTFTQVSEDGSTSMEYASGSDTGLYFPGMGGVFDFGTYSKKSIQLKVKYTDSVSGIKSVYYGLFGNAPATEASYNPLTGYATIEVIAALTKQTSFVIQCYAEDEAGNRSDVIKLSPNGTEDNYEWMVEQNAPKIEQFAVKAQLEDNQTIFVNGNRTWYNHCVAELTVSDADAGLRKVVWHINDQETTQEYATKNVTSTTLSQEITQELYPSSGAEYDVYAEVYDNAGNVVKTDAIHFMLDDVKPDLTVDYGEVWRQDRTVVFNVSDDLSGVDYAKVTDSAGNTIDCKLDRADEDGVYTASFEVTEKGVYTIKVVDHAGNAQTWSENIDKISNVAPPCPTISVTPEETDGENGWYVTAPDVTVWNVTKTEDNTPANTWYQMWQEGDSVYNENIINDSKVTRTIPGDGIYNVKAWSQSYSGVMCADSENDVVQIKVDSTAPDISFTTEKGSGASVRINYRVTDAGSGVDADSIKVMHNGQELLTEVSDSDNGYTGSFEITETGNYSIYARDLAGNIADVAAFTPMSMKVKAVTNISASSATIAANVIKGTFDIESASISYRKLSDEEYKEAESILTTDENGNVAVSAVLSELEEKTPYVFKVVATSAAPTEAAAGEVLEYEGYFKTLSTDESGISITGTARYANSAEGSITVGLFEGSLCVMATEVNAGDEFTFTNVPDGNYNIVATDATYSKSVRVLINEGVIIYPTTYIDLVLSGKNTSIVLTTEDTPNVTADNLDSIFDDDPINYTTDDAALIDAGGTVEFKLYATLMSVSNVSANEISAMYAVTDHNKIVGAYLDLSLYKITTDANGKVERTRVTDLAKGANVSITIPLGDLAGKSGLEVVRIHDTGDSFVGASLQDMDNNPGTYTITTSQFSTYAVLYSPDSKDDSSTEVTTEEQSTEKTTAATTETITTEKPNKTETTPTTEQKIKKNKKKPTASGGGTSVGSLRSSGSAKTGDEAPLVACVLLGMTSIALFVILRRKAVSKK